MKEEEKEEPAVEILAGIDKLLAEQDPDCDEGVTDKLFATVDRVLGEQRKSSDEAESPITSDSGEQSSSEEQKSAEKLLMKGNRKKRL